MMRQSIIGMMSEDLGVPCHDIERIVKTAPYRYKTFQIPKRKKGEYRTIAQPAYELKILQRWMVENFLSDLPVHACAMAYIVGTGIRANASLHVSNSYLVKLDFNNFFPSIKPADLFRHIQKYRMGSLGDEDLETVKRLLFWKRRSKCDYELCIGAPSSPAVSNTIMFDFDTTVARWCEDLGVTYTRYADDLTFSSSSKEAIATLPNRIREALGDLSYPHLSLNDKKTVFVSKRSRRVVTGLILSSQGNVSLGRDRKRIISAKIHAFAIGRLGGEEMSYLKGLLAFASDVEPGFIQRMRNKYGDQVISRIFSIK